MRINTGWIHTCTIIYQVRIDHINVNRVEKPLQNRIN